MSLSVVVARLLAANETAVLALWARHLAGDLDEATFVVLAAAEIDRANARAVTAADAAVAAVLTAQLRRPVPPVGFPVATGQPRLREAVRTVLADPVDYPQTVDELAESRAVRLGRLARAEPAGAAQNAVHEVMQRQPVQGWRRAVNAGACPLCRRWADGKVRRPTVRMARHIGCSCIQQPIAASS